MPSSPLRLAVFLVLVGTSTSHAATGTWANNTGDADANWSAGTNWISGNIPGSSDITISNTDVASFLSSATVETPILDSNRRLDRVLIENAQADYSILTSVPGNILYLQRAPAAGNALAITGGGTTIIEPEVRIGTTSQSWNTGSASTGNASVTLAGGLSFVPTTTTLTLLNLSPIVVQGTLSHASGSGTFQLSGSGSMDITGSVLSSVTIDNPAAFTGRLRLSGNNSITGTVLWRAGTLELNNTGALGTSNLLRLGTSSGGSAASRVVTLVPMTITAAVSTNSGQRNPTITLGGEHTSGTTIFSNTVTLTAPGPDFTGFNVTAANGGLVDFTGVISGPSTVPLFKVGTGVVRFTAENTYAGTTTISAGTLLANNSSGSGTSSNTVTVSSTGTLGGTGSAAGAVNVNIGGTLSPGDSTGAANAGAGTFAIGGALAFAANSNVAFELNGTNAGDGAGFYDQIIAGNSVTLNGDVNFTLTLGIDPSDDGTQLFTLFDRTASGAIGGSGLLNLNGTNVLTQGEIFSFGGQSFQISYTSGGTVGTFLGGGNELALLAIPEPGTASIAFAGLLLLTGLRGFHRRRLT